MKHSHHSSALTMLLISGCMGFCQVSAQADAVFDLKTARLALDPRGVVRALEFSDGGRWPAGREPAFFLETSRGRLFPKAVDLSGDRLRVTWEDGRTVEFSVRLERGLALFRLVKASSLEGGEQLGLFQLAAPADAVLAPLPNAALARGRSAAVMAAEPNVQAVLSHASSPRSDRPGCRHEFVRINQAKLGNGAARFTATADGKPGGWSFRGKMLPGVLDLTGCKAIRAWVHGDGQGEHLKLQLGDGIGGARDFYLPVDFKGWRQVTLTESPYNTLRHDHVTALNFYYNSLPPGKTVECLLDQVEVLIERHGMEKAIVLEDFEAAESDLWGPPLASLQVHTLRKHGLQPAAFGVIVCPEKEFYDTVSRFERLAGLPSPHPGGVWHKQSPWTRRSYFFLTDFREKEFDQALAIARRGGFHTILIGQESWCRATGHFDINRDHFPDGLAGLQRTVRRFKDAGFRVGLHFLGASIDPPDSYLTPVPDPRLVKGAAAVLGGDVAARSAFLPTVASPEGFPDEDGGYMGRGMVLQVGEELIVYGARSTKSPFGFKECRRGYLGTRPAAHRQGEPVRHLVRSYGYHMFDMDTSLLEEVAANFARVANACNIDMIYFDGSELLQGDPGDHWYYNARLHKAYYDKLANKDMLLQASSCSHYSWHLLARSASADGHGDLKGYLDERSPGFDWLAQSSMPLDIGWYYGYDMECPLDMYEYVLGATIGYDSSMSFQVSPSAAARHPFSGAILDLIRRYEQLRFSGRVPAEMKARLRIDPSLGGPKEPAEREKLRDRRREYRLLGEPGKEVFQRVVYEPWREIVPSSQQPAWTVAVKQGPARLGVQIHARPGAWAEPGPSYKAADALVLESFDDLAPYLRQPQGRSNIAVVDQADGGVTLSGVTQRLERSQDAREGRHFAVYSAQSKLPREGGWSMIGKSFHPPLDLSWHRAIGLWLRGDGGGGQFKVQLLDGKGAMDYYIHNNYVGWRYHQLPRLERDPIDYRKVLSLNFYYNGLPGKKRIACAIDDIKALRRVDEPALVDPWFEIGGKRWQWQGNLASGDYLISWPGESITQYAPLKEAERFAGTATEIELPTGEHAVKFGCARLQAMAVRVRVAWQPSEKYKVP